MSQCSESRRILPDGIFGMDNVNNPAPGKPRVDMPLEVELEIMQLRGLLNHYFTSSYPLDGISANDDDDEVDNDG